MCRRCYSSERHRIVYNIYQALMPLPAEWSCLQFSKDQSLDESWFKSYEYSMYEQHNSLDMMDLALEEGAYDLIVSNHVLEHVPSDSKAIAECLRVVGPKGLVHVTVPKPSTQFETTDWGFCDVDQNEHFRHYGTDLAPLLASYVPGTQYLAVIGTDPVTLLSDTLVFLSRSRETLEKLAAPLLRQGFPCVSSLSEVSTASTN